MKKYMIYMLLLLITIATVSAVGSGIIIPRTFEDALAGETYTKSIAAYATGFEEPPELVIEASGETAEWTSFEVTDIIGYLTDDGQQSWKYEFDLIVSIPRKTKKDFYEGAITTKSCQEGGNICVGATASVKVDVVGKAKKRK